MKNVIISRNPFVNQVVSFRVSLSFRKNKPINIRAREPPFKKILIMKITSFSIDLMYHKVSFLIIICLLRELVWRPTNNVQ